MRSKHDKFLRIGSAPTPNARSSTSLYAIPRRSVLPETFTEPTTEGDAGEAISPPETQMNYYSLPKANVLEFPKRAISFTVSDTLTGLNQEDGLPGVETFTVADIAPRPTKSVVPIIATVVASVVPKDRATQQAMVMTERKH